MAVYNDSQLAGRVQSVLYANGSKDIDATELRDLLLDFVDSKINASGNIGIPVHGTIDSGDLTDNQVTIIHNLNTGFPVVFIKSFWPDSDVWSAIHFSYGPVGVNQVWIRFEEDIPAGSSVAYIICKF